jgi:hypothetical protein
MRDAATGPEVGRWPTGRQADLIVAATAKDRRAAAAWQRWQGGGGDLQRLDAASSRLLPLLWSNRRAANIEAEALMLLKGCYRHSLWMTHRTLAGGVAALDTLEATGIPTLVLKGTAILARFPGQVGVRPINDVDILVRRADASRALAALEQDGWRPVNPTQRPIGVWHAVDLVRTAGERIDLHWSATVVPGDDRAIWREAQSGHVAGRPVKVPSATAQLLVTCVHGLGPDPAPVRWIADALLILEGDETIDWPALVGEARRRGVGIALSAALSGLRSQFDADVPASVPRQLAGWPARVLERLAHRAAGRTGRGSVYAVELHRYRRLRAINDSDRAHTFVSHCARRWGFESSTSLVRAGVRRAGQLARYGRAATWADLAQREGIKPPAR